MTSQRSFSSSGLPAAEIGAIALRVGVSLERLDEEVKSLEQSYRELTEQDVEFRSSAATDILAT